MLRATATVIAIAAGTLTTGCSGASPSPGAHDAARPGQSSVAVFSPTCGVVSGGLPPDYKAHSLVTGPVALYRAREWAAYPSRYMHNEREGLQQALRGEHRPRERHRLRTLLRRTEKDRAVRYPPFESALTVDAGHRATITVVGAARAHFAWLFDPRAWVDAGRGYRVIDGEQAIQVTGCRRPYAQYQGGFVLDGPRCITIDVSIDGGVATRRRFAVGSTARCPDA